MCQDEEAQYAHVDPNQGDHMQFVLAWLFCSAGKMGREIGPEDSASAGMSA